MWYSHSLLTRFSQYYLCVQIRHNCARRYCIGNHERYGITEHLNPYDLSLGYWSPFQYSRQVTFATCDSHRLRGFKRNPLRFFYLRLSHTHTVINGNACIAPYITINSDYILTAIRSITGPDNSSCDILTLYLHHIACNNAKLTHCLSIYTRYTSPGIAMVRFRYAEYHLSLLFLFVCHFTPLQQYLYNSVYNCIRL